MFLRLIRNCIYTALALCFAALAFFIYYQRDYIYFPKKDKVVLEQTDWSSTFQEIEVKSEDGIALTGWYAPATRKPYTIIFFHGNADNILNSTFAALPYLDAGYGFVLAEYRGYSGNDGAPTENGLYADGRAFVHKLFDLGVDVEKIVIMGHSLGTAVATQMIQEFRPAGGILISPMTSLQMLAERYYPYFPSNLFLLDHFDNAERITSLRSPLMIVHGDLDTIIPLKHAEHLYEAANDPKELKILTGFGHNDLFDEASTAIIDWLSFLHKQE
jgi:fermentation-respiration switch protein FrsA (DUF1100 family)